MKKKTKETGRRINKLEKFKTEERQIENLIQIQRDLYMSLCTTRTPDEVFRLGVEAAINVQGMDCGGIYLFNKTYDTLDLLFFKGLHPQFIKKASHFSTNSTITRIVMAGSPIYTQKQRLGVPFDMVDSREGLRAMAVLPIHQNDRVIGCLHTSSHTHYEVSIITRYALEGITSQISSTIARLEAEKTQRFSEQLNKAIVDVSIDRITLLDKNMKIIWTNKTSNIESGLDSNYLKEKYCYQIFADKNMPCIRCPVKKSFKSGKVEYGVLYQPKTKTGEKERYLAVSITPIKNDMGDIENFIEVARNMSETKRIEEVLIETEDTLRAILAASPVGIGLVRNRIMYWANSAMDHMLGFGDGELLGKGSRMIYQNDEEYSRVGEELYSSGEVETQWIMKNGKVIDIYLQASPLNPLDASKGFIVVAVNISEQKKIIRMLREETLRNELILKTTMDGLLLMDLKGKIKEVNNAAVSITGYSSEELVGLDIFHFDVDGFFQEHINRVLEKGSDRFETKFPHKNGQILDIEISTRNIEINKEKIFFSFFRDITWGKQIEQTMKIKEKELRTKARNLQEANVALKVLMKRRDEDKTDLEKKMLINVKHLIMPYLEKLKKSGLNEKQSTYAEILGSNLNDMFTPFLYKLSSEYLNLTPMEIQVSDLIRYGKTSKEIAELLNLSNQTIEAHRKNIRKKLGITNKSVNLRTLLLSQSGG